MARIGWHTHIVSVHSQRKPPYPCRDDVARVVHTRFCTNHLPARVRTRTGGFAALVREARDGKSVSVSSYARDKIRCFPRRTVMNNAG